ncbi:MAG: TonB-dependent receptor [Vicinamibacterales bacterium]
MTSFLPVALLLLQFAPALSGELRITVRDLAGLPVRTVVDVAGDAAQVHALVETDARGVAVARRLPFGTYRITVTDAASGRATGFAEVRSALPTEFQLVLGAAAVQAQVTVDAVSTLAAPRQTGSQRRIGAERLATRSFSLPGRTMPDLVANEPGWLLESNGTLHPRGSEVQTQFVVDGLPLTDNRSPAFAPSMDLSDLHAVTILTGGYPAEYGRKLGGVIEIDTSGDTLRGFHGSFEGSAGSFASGGLAGGGTYAWSRGILTVTGSGARTDRYLDPPVEENLTNRGSSGRLSVHAEGDLTTADRLGVIVRRGRASFLVPNEPQQEATGQRQSRANDETMLQGSYRRVFNTPLLFDVRAMQRSHSAGLTSNAASTPVNLREDRGFRESYAKATVTGQRGRHEWKMGGDVSVTAVREAFDYTVTDEDHLPAGTPLAFGFAERRSGHEAAVFMQDQIRGERFTLNAGLRFDTYALVVSDRALSPRVSGAWSWPGRGLVLRASYDRAFQTPAFEHLLIASSPQVTVLAEQITRLPVLPSRGHFLEAGLARTVGERWRVEGVVFDRRMDHFADDDVLLNTGISIPITFHSAHVRGLETTLDVPRWKRLSATLGYTLMRGTGEGPVTGGLFLGEEELDALEQGVFPLTQDQRHTLRLRLQTTLGTRAWAAGGLAVNSGLPVEADDDLDEAEERYGEPIVSRVNLAEGRVRPTWSLDAAFGATLAHRGSTRLTLQADVRNLTNRLNIINFAGLFSGTGIAAPRTVGVQMRLEF